MARLPRLSGQELLKALHRAGFEPKRQRGSHVVVQKGRAVFSVPLHAELKPGTLRGILRQAGMTVEELEGFLR